MLNLASFARCIQHFFNYSKTKLACLYNSILHLLHFILLRVNLFWIELSYFFIFSIVGFLALKFSSPKNPSFTPSDIDMFFTSVSAVTVSSNSTVEMEAFSNSQLILLTILIFFGGEVFTSFIGLQLLKFKNNQNHRREDKVEIFSTSSEDSSNTNPTDLIDQIELGIVSDDQKLADDQPLETSREIAKNHLVGQDFQRRKSVELLPHLVLCYILAVHLFGYTLVSIYILTVSSARNVLKKKGINLLTFSAFTAISTFANCGFIPTNENMMVFKKNSGLLLILIPQILMGNTLYPPCLRFFIWLLQKFTKKAEFTYILKNSTEMGYNHLLSGLHSVFLAITAFGFIFLQFILFCSMEWNSDSTDHLRVDEKLVGSLFAVVNSRHAGEYVFDLSLVSPAMLALFVLMMYLPPYTYLQPIDEDAKSVATTEEKIKRQRSNSILECLSFSQLTYLFICIILICIFERDKMNEDSLNFNLLSIAVEVVSAYGNVGFSMGYSCGKRIKPDGNCKDASYGFAGRWSNEGKFVLIFLMFFGKFKKLYPKGTKAWKIS